MTIPSNTVPLCVINQTSDTLEVTGSYGSDLTGLTPGFKIGPSGGQVVAYFNLPAEGVDNYDWVYLINDSTGDLYQIYVEWNRTNGNTYAFFGYESEQSSQREGNPSPFPDGCAEANFITAGSAAGFPVYILAAVPPSLNPGR